MMVQRAVILSRQPGIEIATQNQHILRSGRQLPQQVCQCSQTHIHREGRPHVGIDDDGTGRPQPDDQGMRQA
jgi:hypothetical protein